MKDYSYMFDCRYSDDGKLVTIKTTDGKTLTYTTEDYQRRMKNLAKQTKPKP